MCFSAPVSLVAGAALSAVGVVTLRTARRPAELPFAGIPLLFGLQQLTEGLIWLSFRADGAWPSAQLTLVYSLFSHVLWPVYMPYAVALLETESRTRRVLAVCQAAGLGVGAYLLYTILRYPVSAGVLGGHIGYDSPHFFVVPVVTLYLVATCVSSLTSSHRLIRAFGAATFAASVAAYAIHVATWISVWCFFAAVLSAMVWAFFWRRRAGQDSV
ncbi:MAG: hypothetical protein HYV16_01935 [Gammaproteobacteria bacterium]|nr:hypothetical protein [Gammaproteobacteria bacterium]